MSKIKTPSFDSCLYSISTLSLAGSLEPLGQMIVSLLWNISESQPEFDELPIIISEHENTIIGACKSGDTRQVSQSVCAMLRKILRFSSKEKMGNADDKFIELSNAINHKNPAVISEGLRQIVNHLSNNKQTMGSLPVVMGNDGIRIGRHCKITFCRTLRIPDDGKVYPLPAGLGHFPLHAVADYANQVPQEWLETGGFFLPMYQSEAMYLELGGQPWRPNIAKVGVGRINAVTGKPWDERIHATEQDYVLCPQQKWLDGINAGQGFVRQFVAMPLGRGYTVEEQVTDECQFGGIQIAVFAAKAGIFPEIDPKECAKARLMPRDAALLAGILQLPSPYQGALSMHLLGYSQERILNSLEIPEAVVDDYETKTKKGLRGSAFRHYKKGDGKQKLLCEIQREALNRLEPLVNNKEDYSRLETELFPKDSDIRFRRRSDAEVIMGLAAGGRLKQKIITDPFGALTWDQATRGSVFIHLVNSEVYQQITGNRPPTRPIGASDYQSLGVPWYSYYDDHASSVGPSRILSRIKSIFSLDQQRLKEVKPEESIPVDPQKIRDIKIPSREERLTLLLSATRAAARNGAFKSVVRLTTSMLDLHGDFVPAMWIRAEAHLNLGFYDEARGDADQVIKLSKDNESSMAARCIRAEVALLSGSPEMALLEAKVAMRVSGNNPALAAIIEKANAMLGSR